jgi:hypothetical protein
MMQPASGEWEGYFRQLSTAAGPDALPSCFPPSYSTSLSPLLQAEVNELRLAKEAELQRQDEWRGLKGQLATLHKEQQQQQQQQRPT